MKHTQPSFSISAGAYDQIYEFIGLHPAERGMIIGCDRDGVIRHVVADENAHCNSAVYDPDIPTMNAVIKKWKTENIEFIGFVHSHPKGICQPSAHDHWYAGEILSCFKKLKIMWMPIVQTIPDTGSFKIIPYAVFPSKDNRKKVSVFACPLLVNGTPKVSMMQTKEIKTRHTYIRPVSKSKSHMTSEEQNIATNLACNNNDKINYCCWFGVQKELGTTFGLKINSEADLVRSRDSRNILGRWNDAKKSHQLYFQRLEHHYDLEHLDKTRLIIIGTGGASSFVRNCARMGIGEYIIIDPDTVSASNIGTQDALPSSIGKTKVEVLAKDLVEINPTSSVAAFPLKIEDFDDDFFEQLIRNPMRWQLVGKVNPYSKAYALTSPSQMIIPKRTILLVLTDNFEAQARGHRLGLQFGLPTICAQEYIEGIGAEITYTVPDVTRACHRCITSSRYKAYLKEGYKNDVASAGAPVFAAEFLNAALGHMLLAIVHHQTDHPRWGKVINDLGCRNLLRIRMDNSFDQRLGTPVFSNRMLGVKDPSVFHSLDTLFLHQTPDSGQSKTRPVCPDCGGSGDLAASIGRFSNTKEMKN